MNSNTSQTHSTAPTIEGPQHAASVMYELWERTADRLTKPELEWFAGATESALVNMENLEDVILGIGCMVGSDISEKYGAPKSGCFQNHENLPALLFFLGQSINHARALVAVSTEANSKLRRLALVSA